jgi:hypothetical protein
MIRVFTERKEKEAAPEKAAASEVTADATDEGRFEQGFQLLFGNYLREFGVRIERVEAEVAERLETLEGRAIAQAEGLEQLADKAQAGVEREHDEYRRRRSIEADLQERVGQLRVKVDSALEEFGKKTSHIEHSVGEQLHMLRNMQRAAEAEVQQQILDDLAQDIVRLAAGKVDRTELATLLVTAARDLSSEATERQ